MEYINANTARYFGLENNSTGATLSVIFEKLNSINWLRIYSRDTLFC